MSGIDLAEMVKLSLLLFISSRHICVLESVVPPLDTRERVSCVRIFTYFRSHLTTRCDPVSSITQVFPTTNALRLEHMPTLLAAKTAACRGFARQGPPPVSHPTSPWLIPWPRRRREESAAGADAASAMELRVGKKYRLGRKIGSGSFGDIYLGTNMTTGEEVSKYRGCLGSPHELSRS